MNVIFNIAPRRSGKTTKLLEEFIEKANNGDKCLFVTINSYTQKEIEHKIQSKNCYVNPYYAVFEPSTLDFNKYDFYSYDNVFLDEFMLYEEKDRIAIVDYLVRLNEKNNSINVVVETTSNKLYSENELNSLYTKIYSFINVPGESWVLVSKICTLGRYDKLSSIEQGFYKQFTTDEYISEMAKEALTYCIDNDKINVESAEYIFKKGYEMGLKKCLTDKNYFNN